MNRPELNLHQKVLEAIKRGENDEQKANFALQAVRGWYHARGHFARAYEIDPHIKQSANT